MHCGSCWSWPRSGSSSHVCKWCSLEGPVCSHKLVFKCAPNIVVKAVGDWRLYGAQYTTLLYLQKHSPALPAPETWGWSRWTGFPYLFLWLICLQTPFGSVARYDLNPKSSIKEQLGTILMDLKLYIYYPCSSRGVGGEGCKDIASGGQTYYG